MRTSTLAVRDANGLLPGAEVALVNEETNATRSTLVNGAGEYAFANVLPGTYTIRASLTGFKTFDASGTRIGTQDFLTLDLRLEVGEVREAVIVTGRTPILETANASVGTMLDRSTLEMLPNAARNVFVLSWTTRNVIPSGAPQFVRQQDQNANSALSLAGGPRRGGVQGDPLAFFQPRTVNTLALNDVLIPGDRSVLAFRYGFTRFRDDVVSAPSDASSLGFSPGLTTAIRGFPGITTEGYGVFGSLFDGESTRTVLSTPIQRMFRPQS